ncbi:5'-nucleotidase C-terminal domain-containing protein [bacterium]|nr:5'-nucleotidase C-terminal domain-containing protein [bacterium]
MRRYRLAAVLMLAIVVLASCSHAPKTYELTIIGTADLQGMLEPVVGETDTDGDGVPEPTVTGGIARIGTRIHEIVAERPGRVVVISAGDDLMNRYFHAYKGEAIFRLMSMAGYDTYAFGNHEFDKGTDVLAAALDHAEFDCLCSDLVVEGTVLEGLCVPWFIRDYDGLRVGFFSLMTENFPLVTSAHDIAMTGRNFEVALGAVRALRESGAQVVIAVTHIGVEEDLRLAREVPGIDIIFGGHSHDYTPTLHRMGGTLIVNGGEKGPLLVRIDLVTDERGRLNLEAARFELIPIDESITPDPEIEAVLAGYAASFPEAIIVGRTDVDWDLTKATVRGGESPVANLVNDYMREKFGVDVVVNNAGAFRGKKVYAAGPVTDVMLNEIDEFKNYAYTLEIDGRYLTEVLERSAASHGEGGWLHVSGVRYEVDLGGVAQVLEETATGEWGVAIPGARVRSVEIMGEDGIWAPLDPDATYSMLSNSFIVKHAGDGYFWFTRYGSGVKNTYSTFYSILAEAASNSDALNPSPPDGRVRIVRQ